jgi:hypothetical protein
MSGPQLGRVEFGGPDLPPRRLRDLLQSHVDRAAPGSRIDWATYYFRDRALAEALIRASDRGVNVRLVMEPEPRRLEANQPVIALLRAHGLNGGFYLRSPRGRGGVEGNLHAKIYAFSDPEIAWIGSFNPSGNDPEDPAVIAEIGDQDRGHNLLLGIERPKLVAALRGFIDRLIDPPATSLWLRWSSYGHVQDGDSRLYLYPRILTWAVEPSVALLPRSGSVRAAISHLKMGPLTWALAKAAGRGALIDLLVHDTERRVSAKAFDFLERAGVRIRRVADPDDLPMHAKFILVTRNKWTKAWLGSHNFNVKSRLHNAEVLLSTRDQQVVAALSKRFDEIASMVC